MAVLGVLRMSSYASHTPSPSHRFAPKAGSDRARKVYQKHPAFSTRTVERDESSGEPPVRGCLAGFPISDSTPSLNHTDLTRVGAPATSWIRFAPSAGMAGESRECPEG